ncbi:MAG: response regulator, partial [Verrucomicrobia bacterium]|nr:response regulator [Verrucomicrobiota bacterium]
VLFNLAVNARTAMPHGGSLRFETRDVDLHPAYTQAYPGVQPGRYVLLAVTDTGLGMSPEVQTRIFEPFFTAADVGQAAGLGLAAVHGMVKQSGGHMEVCSLPALGTTFKLYLPAVEEPVAQGPENLPSKPTRGHGERVLLVDDLAPVRAVTMCLLESLGYQVLEAASAAEALDLVEAGPEKVELLMTDVIMPGQNGRELADALRSRDPNLKVLFQSGYTGDAMSRYGIVESEMVFLQKPFTLEALAQKVREALERP